MLMSRVSRWRMLGVLLLAGCTASADSMPASLPLPKVESCEGIGSNDKDDFCFKRDAAGQLEIAVPLGLVFQVEDNLALCKDIFKTPLFHEAVEKAGIWGTKLSLEEVRRKPARPSFYDDSNKPWESFLEEGELRGSLWKVFNAVRTWEYVDVERYAGAFQVNAVVRPVEEDSGQAEVIFFRGSCAPRKLYQFALPEMDALTRYIFIAAHELGHVLDAYSGGAPLGHQTPRGEQNATIYGSFWVECWLRLFQSQLTANPQMFSFSERERDCALSNWRKAEQGMSALRSSWNIQKVVLPEQAELPEALQGASGCLSPKEHE
ncbi:hypothetical protein [Corallococcus carmarthensis]|nr:hypothetical protein [Corallococcus carmarthensis]NOK22980.1 hypothetical protein [Corallococcus carmarthensis]